MSSPRLEAIYHPAESPEQPGTVDLTLTADPSLLAGGVRLGVTSVLRLTAPEGASVRVVERTGSSTVFAPAQNNPAGDEWTLNGLRCQPAARHANDGPASAWLVDASGAATDVAVVPMRHSDRPPPAIVAPANEPIPIAGSDCLTPPPRLLESSGGLRRSVRVRAFGPHAATWRTVADLSARLVGPHHGDGTALTLDCRIDDRPDDEYVLMVSGDGATLSAGSPSALRYGMTTLAQLVHHGLPAEVRVEDAPAYPLRIVMLDLARRWQDPEVVEQLIDLAAWRKLSHVQLHLTDDEAWRLPSATYPALAEIGGTRGHGLPIPPQLGSGSAPTGRAYTADEIARWVARAEALGIELIPEIDVPAHCHAVLTALPFLRDPDDLSNATSVQGFRDNALVPGHPRIAEFLHTVFGELADLFPHSSTLHLGGDEVPHDAWTHSPLAAASAGHDGVTSRLASVIISEAAFAITAAGRMWAGWEEVAQLDPPAGNNYVVAWTSAKAIEDVARRGLRVVAAPGEAYYLDMAFRDDWDAPGMTWAGTVPLETTCAFVPPDGVSGVQACLWAEHLRDPSVIDALAFPRLDAVTERGWTGEIRGGADGVRSRSAVQPRFTGSEP